MPADCTGGATLLCTAGDGSLNGLAMPKLRASGAQVARVAIPMPDSANLPPPVVPAGYKLAWQDGRLNPNRARGTTAGQMAQDQVWTREVPARLVTRAEGLDVATVSTQTKAPVLRVSTSGGSTGPSYVQVGSFGQPANAEAAKARLMALGLPVSTARAGTLRIVMAGPFESDDAARLALAVARRGGFPDAILR